MGCDLSKVYNIDIHLENELAVFEPRDEVAGQVIIRAEEDTVIDTCILWLYGLVKTRWNGNQKPASINMVGSIGGGVHFLQSATNLSLFGDPKTFENMCANTAHMLNTVADNVRSEVCQKLGQMRMDKLCYGSTFDCTPWELQPAANGRSFDWPTELPPQPSNARTSSCTSTTDTLAASLEQNSSRSGSIADATHPLQTVDLSGQQLRASSHQVLCKSCETCWPSGFGVKWKSMLDVDPENKVLCGDVKVIYRTRLNLLSRPTVRRHKDSMEQASTSRESESNSSDVDRQRRLKSGESTDERTSQTQGQSSHSTDDSRTADPAKSQHHVYGSPYILTRGTHVFDFEFKLPADLPSSFELPTGCLVGGAAARLYYGLRIEICNKAAQIKHTQHREIIVFRPLELTHFPRLRDRITLHKEFIISGCCSSPKGSILCDLTVNKTGFVPGESITPQVHVTNRSSRPIQTVHLVFAQIVTLRGINNQQHTEILRLFASRLKPRPSTNLDQNLRNSTRFLEDNPSLFSSSLSPSSHTSLNKSDRPRMIDHNDSSLSQAEPTALFKSAVAVNSHGSSAYFEDVIHVPPLPATGLVGRQNLIQVEYTLILRLRLQGDVQGRQDQKMQIPITIGSDPTRETSFIGCSEVVPCYASFNYASGEVIEYDPSVSQRGKSSHLSPVYRYFKPRSTKVSDLKSSTVTIDQVPRSQSKSDDLKHATSRSPSTGQSYSLVRQHPDSPECSPVISESPVRVQVMRNPYVSIDIQKGQYDALKNGNQPVRRYACHSEDLSPEINETYDSPPTPVLSGHCYFDDGDEEHSEAHNRVGVTERASDAQLYPQTDKKQPYDQRIWYDSRKIRSSSLGRHLQPCRQFSFEYYSDHTASDGETERINKLDNLTSDPNYYTHEIIGELSPVHSTHSDSETSSEMHLFGSIKSLHTTSKTSGNRDGKDSFYTEGCVTKQRQISSRGCVNEQQYSKKSTNNANNYHPFVNQNSNVSVPLQRMPDSELVENHSNTSLVPERRSKSRLYNAYWNCPRVAPVHGRNPQGIWTTGHVSNHSQSPTSSQPFDLQVDLDIQPTRLRSASSQVARPTNLTQHKRTQAEFTSSRRSLDNGTLFLEHL